MSKNTIINAKWKNVERGARLVGPSGKVLGNWTFHPDGLSVHCWISGGRVREVKWDLCPWPTVALRATMSVEAAAWDALKWLDVEVVFDRSELGFLPGKEVEE